MMNPKSEHCKQKREEPRLVSNVGKADFALALAATPCGSTKNGRTARINKHGSTDNCGGEVMFMLFMPSIAGIVVTLQAWRIF